MGPRVSQMSGVIVLVATIASCCYESFILIDFILNDRALINHLSSRIIIDYFSMPRTQRGVDASINYKQALMPLGWDGGQVFSTIASRPGLSRVRILQLPILLFQKTSCSKKHGIIALRKRIQWGKRPFGALPGTLVGLKKYNIEEKGKEADKST